MTEIRAASVIVPTVGRPRLLRACLESLTRCEPRAAEIVIVDQSRDRVIPELVAEFAHAGARIVCCNGRGRGHGVNHGLRDAGYEVVLVTDDDCTVGPQWVDVGWKGLKADPVTIVTGKVLPVGDARSVPSTIDDPTPRDYTGKIHYGYLHAGNMVCSRSAVLSFGGFDERIVPSAEDNDFCYRWLRSGRSMRYDPELVVWHHDWRSKKELEELYVRDARGQGVFYGKHLRTGDLTVARFVVIDLYRGARGMAARIIRGRPRWSDGRQGLLRGIPQGLVDGWRASKLAGESINEDTPCWPGARREPGI